jgi:hypothetical protein
MHKDGETGTGGWKRPQSANNSYFRGGNLSISSLAASGCDGMEKIMHTQCDGSCRNNFSAKFSSLDVNVHNCVMEKEPHNKKAGNNLKGLCLCHRL